jgi:hypothetical protein
MPALNTSGPIRLKMRADRLTLESVVETVVEI